MSWNPCTSLSNMSLPEKIEKLRSLGYHTEADRLEAGEPLQKVAKSVLKPIKQAAAKRASQTRKAFRARMREDNKRPPALAAPSPPPLSKLKKASAVQKKPDPKSKRGSKKLRQKKRIEAAANQMIQRGSVLGVTVYGLFEGEVIKYVGQTRHMLEVRLDHHRKRAQNPQYPVHQWLRNCIETGVQFEIKALQTNAIWDVDEIRWIKKVSHKGLLNLTPGGPYRPNMTIAEKNDYTKVVKLIQS